MPSDCDSTSDEETFDVLSKRYLEDLYTNQAYARKCKRGSRSIMRIKNYPEVADIQSSSDIEIVGSSDFNSSDSSVSSEWSVVNPTVNTPNKKVQIPKSSKKIQTECTTLESYKNFIPASRKTITLTIIVTLASIIVGLNLRRNTNEQGHIQLQGIETEMKKLEIEIIKTKQNIMKFNRNSSIPDIEYLKKEMETLKKMLQTKISNGILLQQNMKDLQRENTNIKNELLKFQKFLTRSLDINNILIKNSNNTSDCLTANKMENANKNSHLSESTTGKKMNIQNKKEYFSVVSIEESITPNPQKDNSTSINWILHRAIGRTKQRKELSDVDTWFFVRAYGRDYLRKINKNNMEMVQHWFLRHKSNWRSNNYYEK